MVPLVWTMTLLSTVMVPLLMATPPACSYVLPSVCQPPLNEPLARVSNDQEPVAKQGCQSSHAKLASYSPLTDWLFHARPVLPCRRLLGLMATRLPSMMDVSRPVELLLGSPASCI